MIVLMFIGASPSSTGGGVKTSTVAVLLATVWATIRGDSETVIMGRRIPADVIRRALTIVSLAMMLLLVVTSILTITEKHLTIRLLFEATSAFGTVGLTTGITPQLTKIARMLLIMVMFAGRVGPLTLAAAVAARLKPSPVIPAAGRVMVG
jgi:trk system potassium uptake protein TrkH